MKEFDTYTDKICWDRKRMDNINYNFEIVDILINSCIQLPTETQAYYYKPLFIEITSIIECILYDFLVRIQEHTQEKIPNLVQHDIDQIKDKEIPKYLRSYVDICAKHSLIGKDPELYKSIIRIADIRNRIHIQNIANTMPFDEAYIWNVGTVKECGHIMKDIICYIAQLHHRPTEEKNAQLPLFPTPWDNL